MPEAETVNGGVMIDISKKKLPTPAISAMVYISYCAMSWFVMRGNLAMYGSRMDFPSWFTNDAWAFFLGGLFPFLLYGIFTTFVFKMLPLKTGGGDVKSIKYGLNYAVIAANLILFLLKFMYIALPLYAPVIDIIIDPVVTVGVVALYMWYAFYLDYVDRSVYHAVVTQVLGVFLAVYGLLALINTVLAVA